jgi:hypothetical protein
VPAAASASLLRRRWGISFVVAPEGTVYAARAARLRFPLLARSPGATAVYRVPDEPLAPFMELQLKDTADAARAPSRGAFAWGFEPPASIEVLGERHAGRWAGPEAGLLVPVAPGRHELFVAAPSTPTRVTVRWGTERAVTRTVTGLAAIDLDVTTRDLAADGALLVSLGSRGFVPDHGALFVISLTRR